MTRWEYLYFTDAEKDPSTLHPPVHKEKLNELGKEGWELVSVVFDQTGKVQKLYCQKTDQVIFAWTGCTARPLKKRREVFKESIQMAEYWPPLHPQ
jgi:hypothetical protein